MTTPLPNPFDPSTNIPAASQPKQDRLPELAPLFIAAVANAVLRYPMTDRDALPLFLRQIPNSAKPE